MGIPHYVAHVARRHADAVRVLSQSARLDCQRLYVDFNSVVHMAARAVRLRWALRAAGPDPQSEEDARRMEDDIIAASLAHLDALDARMRPRALLFVAVDGTPPRAKMQQQRARRYMAAWRASAGLDEGAGDDAPLAPWDSNAITPGTAFMERLDAALRRAAERAGPRLVASCSDAPGEGEQKIFAHLRADPPAATRHHGERAVVYGLDADLCVMAVLHPAAHALVVAREQELGGEMQVVDAGRLRGAVLRFMGQPQRGGSSSSSSAQTAEEREDAEAEDAAAVADYAVLVSLLGNDFLPGLACLRIQEGGLDALTRAYTCARKALPGHRLCDGGPEELGGLDAQLLARVLGALAEQEEAMLCAADARYWRRVEWAAAQARARRPLAPDDWPVRFPDPPLVRPGEPGPWRARYHRHLLGTCEPAGVRAACAAYVAGVAWSLQYMQQRCLADAWLYPHAHAPTALDLYHLLLEGGPEAPAPCAALRAAAAAGSCSAAARAALSPAAARAWQLLMVLPPRSAARLLPAALRPVVTDTAVGCKHMFPDGFRVATYLNDKLWKCAPLLPPVDTRLLLAGAAAAACAI